MIKVEKNILAIPDSLQIPDDEFFPNGIPRVSKTTHKRRVEVIEGGKYIDEGKYNDRYKKGDVRVALKAIYNNKCAFCEQKIEQYQIEHYRPKKTYYWLAFSWDNLLMACATCNQHKGVNFELSGDQAFFEDSANNRKLINSVSASYDLTEIPKMVNPEKTNPLGLIKFNKGGEIYSDDERFLYTIDKCKVDRDYLNDERRRIMDEFIRDIESALIENDSLQDQQSELKTLVRKFIRDSEDKHTQFLGFRRFVISENFLNDSIKDAAS